MQTVAVKPSQANKGTWEMLSSSRGD